MTRMSPVHVLEQAEQTKESSAHSWLGLEPALHYTHRKKAAFLWMLSLLCITERRRKANEAANNGKERKDLYTDNCELAALHVFLS